VSVHALETDRPAGGPTPGTARAALAQPAYRRMYVSGFLSNIGTWMQTVVLGPFALALSDNSASFVGLLMMAQLGPLLVLSIPGGALAARISNRRAYMISLVMVQILCALFLAGLAQLDTPNRWVLVLGVLGGGVANALMAPLYNSILPEIVGRENIPGAVSLGSAQVNGSRVLGPVILAVLSSFVRITPTAVFTFNAASFLLVIWAVSTITFPRLERRTDEVKGFGVLLVGFSETRANPVARRVLSIMFVFSLLCLAYVAQFPAIAENLLGLESSGRTYLFLFGTWGFGALCGALSMSTVLAKIDKRRVPMVLLVGFGIMMAVWSMLRDVGPLVFVVLFALGFCYFGTTTALNTVLQQHLSTRTRPYILALWFMCFGGTVPFSGMWAGALMDSQLGHERGAVVVLIAGAVVSVLLAFRGDLRGASNATNALQASPTER
jgi:MFS family permease